VRFLLVVIFYFTFNQPSGFGQISRKAAENKVLFIPDVSFRSFWMNTSYTNEELKPDYALGISTAAGGKLSFAKHWEVQGGYRIFANVFSSPFWEIDPTTRQSNRYESGLFNLLDPKDRFFGRLELLSLSYTQPKFGIKLGKMGIQTEWINSQDGRLSPTVVEGMQAWYSPIASWKISAWGITRMNIRGSKDWIPVGETLGLFPQGRSLSGTPAAYYGNTNSSWVGIWEVEGKLKEGRLLRFSQTIAENLFATYWITYEKTKKNSLGSWNSGIQTGLQQGIGEGGNRDLVKQYKNPSDVNFAFSAKLNWKKGAWETQLNATQIAGKGRWLSPREWGKDAWYTFIPRERNEGFETVTAVVGYASYLFKNHPLQLYSYMGIHVLPKLEDAAANKYNFPSYRQHNFGVRYAPKKIKNLDFHLIFVSKVPLTASTLNPVQQYNKVDLWHFNGLINWKLGKN
jgi:hypothetical protein